MKVNRRIVKIDEDLCNGCGDCIIECHEEAIKIVDGKAKVLNDSLCDGIGDCLGSCPVGAITIEEREALPFDKELVAANLSRNCSSVNAKSYESKHYIKEGAKVSEPGHWPLKIRLAPTDAEYFTNRDLVIAADCSAFVSPEFHERYANGTAILIGCPKFEDKEIFIKKISSILNSSSIRSVTVVRMEVPCCKGLVKSIEDAVSLSGKDVPLKSEIMKTRY